MTPAVLFNTCRRFGIVTGFVLLVGLVFLLAHLHRLTHAPLAVPSDNLA